MAQHQEFLEQYIFGVPPLKVTVYGGMIGASIEAIIAGKSPWVETEGIEGATLLRPDEIKAFRNSDFIEPPPPAELAFVYPHKRLMDPKLRVFIDYMALEIRRRVEALDVPGAAARPARSEVG